MTFLNKQYFLLRLRLRRFYRLSKLSKARLKARLSIMLSALRRWKKKELSLPKLLKTTKKTFSFSKKIFAKRIIMVISSPKKADSKQTSLSIFSISMLLFILGLLSYFSFLQLSQYSQKKAILLKEELREQGLHAQLTKLVDSAEKVNTFHKSYESQISEIFKILGNFKAESLWASQTESQFKSSLRASTKDASTSNHEILESLPLDAFEENLLANLHATFNDQSAKLTKRSKKVYQELLKNRERYAVIAEHTLDLENYLELKGQLSQVIPNGWPLKDSLGYKTSSFGPRFSPFSGSLETHLGIDIAAPKNTKVVALADGMVYLSDESPYFGNVIGIKHAMGFRTLYAHNSEALVKVGQSVKKGEIIALVGSTGRSTGNHLHIEIKIGRKSIDPWPFIIESL